MKYSLDDYRADSEGKSPDGRPGLAAEEFRRFKDVLCSLQIGDGGVKRLKTFDLRLHRLRDAYLESKFHRLGILGMDEKPWKAGVVFPDEKEDEIRLKIRDAVVRDINFFGFEHWEGNFRKLVRGVADAKRRAGNSRGGSHSRRVKPA